MAALQETEKIVSYSEENGKSITVTVADENEARFDVAVT